MQKKVFFCLVISLILSATATVKAQCVRGLTLDQAMQSDFFTNFGFKEAKRGETENGLTLVFMSGGNNPSNLGVYLNESNCICGMMLVLDRKYVDNIRTTLAARDLFKSFLEAAVPANERLPLLPLYNQIYFGAPGCKVVELPGGVINDKDGKLNLVKKSRGLKIGDGPFKVGDSVLQFNGDVPKLPASPTEDYKTFLGQKESYTEKYANYEFRIRNQIVDGDGMILMNFDFPSVKKAQQNNLREGGNSHKSTHH